MINFEERYYRAISSSPSSSLSLCSSSPSSITSSSSLTINSVSTLSLSDSHSLLLVGYENKILWNEIFQNEICTREVQLAHLPELYEINGLWALSIHSKYYLYLSLIYRHTPPSPLPSHPSSATLPEIPSTSTNPLPPSSSTPPSSTPPPPPPCHLLGYEISFPDFSLKPVQDLKISFSILDLKTFIFEQNFFLCCLGNDQKIHVYEVDSLCGTLSRNSKRAKKARGALSSRIKTKRTEMMRESGKEAIALPLPLRFALEDWLMGGSQCLVGYIDGHLHWDRHVEKLVKRTGTTTTQRHQEDEEKLKSLKENCQEVPIEIEIEVPDLLAPSPRPPLPLMELPKSPEIPDAPPLDITSPISTQRSHDISDLMPIAEGSDEEEDDDEDSVDSTLRQYHHPNLSDQPHTSQNPYHAISLHIPSASSPPPKEGIWDDMIETDDPPATVDPVAGEHSNCQQVMDTKLYEMYSKVFLHDPVEHSILPQKNSSLPLPASQYSSMTKIYSYSYLLHGSISCLQFYQREATQIRSFRQKYSPSFVSPVSSSPSYPNSLFSPQAATQRTPQPPLSSSHFKWKDSFCGRTHEPSSCVLIGSSEGDLALLSLERKITQCSSYDEATETLQYSWCWEGDDDEEGVAEEEMGESPYVMKSIFISSSSPSWGSILCVCVTDVTGNGLNDVIVGYDTGLVRILSILDSPPDSGVDSMESNQHQFHQPSRTPSHSADYYEFEGAHPSFPSSSSSSMTMNNELWSVSNSSFHEICQLQLPFPVLAIEYGQFLGDGTGTGEDLNLEGDRSVIGRVEDGRFEEKEDVNSGNVSLGPMNHLLIVTTKSFHVWIPVHQKVKSEMEQTGVAETEVREVSEETGEREEVNEESLEVLEAKKKLILQILEQLDELGEITSHTVG